MQSPNEKDIRPQLDLKYGIALRSKRDYVKQ